MRKNELYISTIACDAAALAQKYGLGIELAQFCTAYNMDERFSDVEQDVSNAMRASQSFIFHAPFNELYPCAIDPKAALLAHERLDQALKLAFSYGIKRLVVHSGNAPQIYYRSWFEERSIIFWKDFLRDKPRDTLILMENVLDVQPEPMLNIANAVNDERFALCLDIGHANCVSSVKLDNWLNVLAPRIRHFHIHNNMGDLDSHSAVFDGSIAIDAFLDAANAACPGSTYTIETVRAQPSVRYLLDKGFIV